MTRDIAAENDRVFHSAHLRCKHRWTCPICESGSKLLVCPNPNKLQSVMCSTCNYKFTLRVPAGKLHTKYVPHPLLNVSWSRVYRRAYRHFKNGLETRAFIDKYEYWQDAYNALNHLDGGSLFPTDPETTLLTELQPETASKRTPHNPRASGRAGLTP